jgi:hypothetical protein
MESRRPVDRRARLDDRGNLPLLEPVLNGQMAFLILDCFVAPSTSVRNANRSMSP